MGYDRIEEMFLNDKLLARAMGEPRLNNVAGEFVFDFTDWAKETHFANSEGLSSLSSTLLVSGERIPTYKSAGFLINSDLAKIEHISETDSLSSGSSSQGDFRARPTNITSISELAKITREKRLRAMNEVNVSVKSDAFIGFFAIRTLSDIPKATALLAQECHKVQTRKTLPIYLYDQDKGTLDAFNPSIKEKISMIDKLNQEYGISSSDIYYRLSDKTITIEEKRFNPIKNLRFENISLQVGKKQANKTTKEHMKNLSYDGINTAITPDETKAPYKPTMDNDTKSKMIKGVLNKEKE